MRSSFVHRAWVVLACLGLLVASAHPVAPQSMEGTGTVATGLLLRQMDGVKRVLMIGAHPDDEDTAMLTTLAREWGAETAYLSLTRGDGGQNLIGPELFEGLGVVRTGELMAARHLDGAGQFFTRAFDYGFSKTADEALSFWPREELLEDVVWVVRKFRPEVVISVFSGTPRDGHGQHQAAGIMAREAFAAAGDPTRFPEQLSRGVEAWTPLKLYQTARGGFGGRGGPPPGAIVVSTGDLDPLLGRSAYQLSMESRSQHRSQGMGARQPLGPRATGVVLVQSLVDGEDSGIFAGIDTTLAGRAGTLAPAAREATLGHLQDYRDALLRAHEGAGLDASTVKDELGEALYHLDQARIVSGADATTELGRALASKLRTATKAFMASAGIELDVRAADDLVVPGQTVRVTAQLWNAGAVELTGAVVRLDVPEGWLVGPPTRDGVASDGSVGPGSLATFTFEVGIPEDAEPSTLYFLRQPRDGAWYRWPDEPALWGLPRDPVPVTATAEFTPRSGEVRLAPRLATESDWRYVGVDPARGEYQKRVLVVPAVSVRTSPEGLVWPAGRSEAASVSVVVHSEDARAVSGEVVLGAPAGWVVAPGRQSFDLPEAGAERAVTFQLRPAGALSPGSYVLHAEARTEDGRTYSEGYSLVDYDHIERAALYAPAESQVTVIPVEARPGLRVGYIMGPGDDGPEAIRQLGVDVTLLSADDVREGAFDDYDTIVLGIRAYETREDLRAAASQILDFVRAGGVVVSQYHRAPMGTLPPYPLEVDRSSPRVTDETAPVTLLDPEAPVFTTPNRIDTSDFQGWVQERGLYFGTSWDDAWVPLLEMSDPGEPPLDGSLLVSSLGDGVFVYTGLSLFRQWGDRVPGAYRLMANLISLDPASWRAYARGR
jgi:LmbE family N-acetylglucosaminyl deacetylase